eukprot:1156859-Pelagomonas_calceolata.AAC.4
MGSFWSPYHTPHSPHGIILVAIPHPSFTTWYHSDCHTKSFIHHMVSFWLPYHIPHSPHGIILVAVPHPSFTTWYHSGCHTTPLIHHMVSFGCHTTSLIHHMVPFDFALPDQNEEMTVPLMDPKSDDRTGSLTLVSFGVRKELVKICKSGQNKKQHWSSVPIRSGLGMLRKSKRMGIEAQKKQSQKLLVSISLIFGVPWAPKVSGDSSKPKAKLYHPQEPERLCAQDSKHEESGEKHKGSGHCMINTTWCRAMKVTSELLQAGGSSKSTVSYNGDYLWSHL